MSNSRRIPDFFKVYLPQQSSQRLLIPNAFVRFCNGSLPKNAVLSNHMGSLWSVKVDFTDRGVFFLHGWQEFVRDNSIKCGDFLIFRYDGKCGFSVKIFGNSACEKRESGAHRTSCMDKEKLEEEVKEKEEEETKENDNDEEDLEDNYDEDDEEEDSTEEEEEDDDEEEEDSTEEEEAIKKRKVRKQSDGNVGGSKERIPVKVGGGSKRNNVIDTQKEEESTIKMSRVRKQSCKNHGGSKRKAGVRVEAEEEEVIIKGSRDRKNRRENNEVSEKMPFGKTGRRSKSTSDVRSEGVDVSKYVQPRNPYVIAKMRAGPKKNLLPVPVKVLKIWKLKLPNLMWFENERGWQCPGNVISWLDGRFWIGGWHDFCMANRVSPDDYCICEFLQGNNQNKDVIKVHIVRNTGSRS